MRSLLRKLSWLTRRSAKEQDLREELEFHLEEEAALRQAQGLEPEDAKWAARRELGNLTLLREETRAAWGWRYLGGGELSDFIVDVKHSIRMFLHSPVFTATAVAALALGIAATTAIFSIVNAVLLKPFPVPDPGSFVTLLTTTVRADGKTALVATASPVKYAHYRAQTDVLQDVSAFRSFVMNYTGGGAPEQWTCLQVSTDTFRSFPLPILRGRAFTPREDSPGGPHVAVISEGLWGRRFGNDPQITGRTVSLNGDPYTIVGVSTFNPAWLEWGPAPDVFVPFQLDPNSTDQSNYFQVMARLRPGVTLEQAQAELEASAPVLRSRFPTALGPKDGLSLETYRKWMIGETGSLLFVLLGAVSLVLSIACANVANLLLVRATGRRREIAIRAAIGAGRGRVIRQLLTESVLLSTAGGALGLLLGYAGIRALLTVNAAGLPRLGIGGIAVGMDWRVLAFGAAVSLLTGILFGLFPAIAGSRADLNTVLKESSGRSGTGLRQNKTRSILVVSEVALAVVLLVGAALLIRSFIALYSVHSGFDGTGVLTMRMFLTGPNSKTTEGVTETIRDGLERVRALPSVVEATASCCIPLQGNATLPFLIPSRPPVSGRFNGSAGWSVISSGYFDVFRIPLKRGRIFDDRDDGRSAPVVLVNEAFARQFLKDADPLNERIVIGRGLSRDFAAEQPRQIVGVVGDVRTQALGAEPPPMMYVPQPQLSDAENQFLVRLTPLGWVARTRGEPHRIAAAMEDQLRQAAGLPVSEVYSMDDLMARSTARQRFNMLLMTVFGAMALLLAAIGIYGLMAYTVAQRKQEIGIRLALGAARTEVIGMVVKQGMRLALAGMAAGLAAAWALSRVMESFLFGVRARDPLVFAAVPLVLALVAFFAVWLPAIRAGKVNPVESIRYE